MKSEFSTSWLGSSQPRKQRKYLYNAPLHLRHKFLSANLSKPLREKYGKRSLPLRKGDEVLVMRGTFRKKKAKIISVDVKDSRVVLEGVNRAKKDGSKVNVYVHPSCLQIFNLELGDKERINTLSRKAVGKKEKKVKQNKEKENAPDKAGSNN